MTRPDGRSIDTTHRDHPTDRVHAKQFAEPAERGSCEVALSEREALLPEERQPEALYLSLIHI